MSGLELTPLQVMLYAFSISSVGGLASLLRSKRPLGARVIIASFLYSGLLGLIVAMLWFNYFQGNVYFMLGISGLAGIGGATALDLMILILKKGGVNIVISPKEDE